MMTFYRGADLARPATLAIATVAEVGILMIATLLLIAACVAAFVEQGLRPGDQLRPWS